MWSGGIRYGFTAFIEPIAGDMGWTYLAISLAFSLRAVEIGLLGPVTGFLTDRFGPRKLTFWGSLIGGAGLLLLSRTDSLVMFYLAVIVVSLGFSGLSQSVTTTAVANWFKKKIGRATGFALAGYGIGGALLPLTASLISQHGWRLAAAVLGLGTWLFVIPLSLILRHKPEQYGYSPDGESSDTPSIIQSPETGTTPEIQLTAAQAMKTKAFWLLAFVFSIQFTVLQAVTLQIMPFCDSVNLSIQVSSMVAMFIPLSSIVGRLSGGWLGDIFDYRKVLVISFVLQCVGLAFLFYGYSLWQLVVFLIFYGPAFGATFVLRSAIIRKRFGVLSFGSIQGLIMGFMAVGGIVGPAFAGWVFDNWGNYRVAWLTFAVAMLVAILMILVGMESLGREARAGLKPRV
jgi:OFA family oxalate/formate antiporter-like MFS transporter